MIPGGRAAVVLGFEPLETLRVVLDYGNSGTRVIMNDRPNYPLGVLAGEEKYPVVRRLEAAIGSTAGRVQVLSATELAKEAGNPVATNIVMTGALAGAGVIPILMEIFRSVIETLFGGDALALNLKAFELGTNAVAQGVVRETAGKC